MLENPAVLLVKIKQFFNNRYSLVLNDDWLKQCIEFLQEEYPEHSVNQYQDLIYVQLKEFDLVEIGTSALPPQLFTTESGTISGRFFLQVVSSVVLCIDTTQPYYAQIQKLTGLINENALVDADNVPTHTQFESNRNSSKTRLLMLMLTDGTRMVKAMEHTPIRQLSDEILPGTKVELHGNIEFRKQMLLLSADKISILGGSVENLSTPEHFVEAIEAELNEKRSNQRSIHERERVANFDPGEYKMTKPSQQHNSNKMQSQTNQIYSNSGASQLKSVKNEMCSQKMTGQAAYKQEVRGFNCANDDDDEDDLLINCDLNSLDAKPSKPFQMGHNNNNNVNQLKSTAEIHQSFRANNQPSGNIKRPPSTDCISSIADNYPNRSSSMPNNKGPGILQTKKPKIDEMMAVDDDDDDESDYRAIKAAASVESAMARSKPSNQDAQRAAAAAAQSPPPLRAMQNVDKFKKQPVQEEDNSQPVDISALLDLMVSCCAFNSAGEPSDISNTVLATCEHEIRCQVKTLTAQLKQVKLKWHQECILADETNDSLAAYISDGPMSQLLEMTCAQAKELFIKSRQQSQMAKPAEDYNTIFTRRRKNCEEVLKSNTFLMRLKYDFTREDFCVVKLTKL